jgi:hypothetical protein
MKFQVLDGNMRVKGLENVERKKLVEIGYPLCTELAVNGWGVVILCHSIIAPQTTNKITFV